MQHYGIDPRKFDNFISTQHTSIGSRGHYNPYSKNSSSINQQRLKMPKNRGFRSTSNQNFKVNKPNDYYSRSTTSATRLERMNRAFDLFIQSIQNEPIYIALEKVAKDIFSAQIVICWNVIIDYKNFPKHPINNDSVAY